MTAAAKSIQETPAQVFLRELGAVLDEAQVERVHEAHRLYATGVKRKGQKADGMLAEIRRELNRDAEVQALALGRGEQVARAKDGRLAVSTRDGLRLLYVAKTINVAQYEAGLMWRHWCEELASSAMVASAWSDAGGGSAPGSRAWQLAHRGRRVRRLTELAREIQRQFPDGRALRALVVVAGEGGCINDLARSGSSRMLYRQQLGAVLSFIARHEGLTGGA